jgi:type III secretory pathway component EscV
LQQHLNKVASPLATVTPKGYSWWATTWSKNENMHKSSIHFNDVQSNSESHNLRGEKLDYVHQELTENNSSWSKCSIAEMEKEIKRYCKATSGRKLQKNSKPIREAVVNLHSNHTLDDLKKLSERLKEEFGMECFQIHIHRDEGLKNEETGVVKINHHAHMLFRWQDMETGKTLKINKLSLSQIQDSVAGQLEMERGEMRVNSNRERLEAIEYKRQQEQIRLDKIQEEVLSLEKKKIGLRESTELLEKTITQRLFGKSLILTREIFNQISSNISAKRLLVKQLLEARKSFLQQKEKLQQLKENIKTQPPKNRGFQM